MSENSPLDDTNKDSMTSPLDIFSRVLVPSMMKDDQLLPKNATFLNSNDEFDQWDYEDGNASEILWLEFTSFIDTWESLIRIYVPLEMGIMSMGFLGNLLAFVTLIRSYNLNTPSITYHKTFVLADLIFCSNYFFNNVVVDKLMMIGGRENQFEFTTLWAAYYSGIVYRAIHLTCTYLISYMTLVITFDRFAALILYKKYQKFNKDSVAGFMVFFCVCLSAFVHSWSAWVLRIAVKTSEISQTDTAMTNNTNTSETYTWIKNPDLHTGMQTAIRISSYYNGIVRLIYPFVVFLLTGLVIYGFVRRQKHIAARYASCRNMGRQRSRYERTLFVFMIAVVFLAFVQIISAEFRRFIEILYPPGDVTANKITDKRLSVDERVRYFRILLYGYQVSRVLSNMCTAVNHSLVCYLYVAMNKIFRRELWSLVRCRPLRGGQCLLRARTMSMAPPPPPGTPRGGPSRKSTATARTASVVKKTSVVSMLVRATSSKNQITVTTTAAATAETSFFRTAPFQLSKKFLDVDSSRLSG